MSLKENSKTDKPLPVNLSPEWAAHLPALKSLRVALDYLDFLRLCSAVSAPEERKKMEDVFQYRWNEESEKLLQAFDRTPEEFQNWAREKKLAFNDLRPLLRAPENSWAPYLSRLSQLSPSKSVGCELLEKICDGDLEAEPFKNSLAAADSADRWLKDLRFLSQPLALGRDEDRNGKVQKWPWPSRAKGQWKRRGDQAGLHIELYSLNPEDLEQKLNELKKFSELWKREL